MQKSGKHGGTTFWGRIMPLNCVLKVVKMVNYTLCSSDHNKTMQRSWWFDSSGVFTASHKSVSVQLAVNGWLSVPPWLPPLLQLCFCLLLVTLMCFTRVSCCTSQRLFPPTIWCQEYWCFWLRKHLLPSPCCCGRWRHLWPWQSHLRVSLTGLFKDEHVP